MEKSFTRFYFFVVLIIISSKTVHSQTTSFHPDTIATFSQYFENRKAIGKIKWTWQLPTSINKAFYESQYKNWFIENMILYNQSGKFFYRFYVNNGNLLDGDHYDNFLKKEYLDISDSDAVIRNQFPK